MPNPQPPLNAVETHRAALDAAVEDGRTADALVAARSLEHALLSVYDALVVRARAEGMSWPEIGRALGVSHQAAHRRFAPLVRTVEGGGYTPGPQPPATRGAQRADQRPTRGRR